MSQEIVTRRVTAPEIRVRKGGEPIVALTSYHANTARIVDQPCGYSSRWRQSRHGSLRHGIQRSACRWI